MTKPAVTLPRRIRWPAQVGLLALIFLGQVAARGEGRPADAATVQKVVNDIWAQVR
jgi:hypothetical protein